MRCIRTAAGALVATLSGLAMAAPVAAQSPSPYDLTFALRGKEPVPLYADMSADAGQVGSLPAGAGGIVLRWCRSEIPFGSWQFGSRKEQLKLLDSRWCEVSWQGRVGNLPGSAIAPE